MALHTGQSTSFEDSIYFSENNPFYRGALVGQCTWYCWSKAHAKATAYPSRGINVENIPTSGAGRWIADAKNKYEIGDDPKQDSIAVWIKKGGTGHVAYVEDYDENTKEVCFSEANMYTGGNPSWEIYVAKQYRDSIATDVAKNTSKVSVYSTAPDGKEGNDGLFKNKKLDEFKSRIGISCQFIYLTQPK